MGCHAAAKNMHTRSSISRLEAGRGPLSLRVTPRDDPTMAKWTDVTGGTVTVAGRRHCATSNRRNRRLPCPPLTPPSVHHQTPLAPRECAAAAVYGMPNGEPPVPALTRRATIKLNERVLLRRSPKTLACPYRTSPTSGSTVRSRRAIILRLTALSFLRSRGSDAEWLVGSSYRRALL